MSNITPGPWQRNVKPASHYVTVFSGRNTHVCCIRPEGKTEEECEANINLIAAAPCLLEALQGLFEHCSMIHKHWGEGCNQKEANAAIASAQAAIKKAQGL